MKRVSTLAFSLYAAKAIGIPGSLQQYRFATSNTNRKDIPDNNSTSYLGTTRELGDYIVGGNTVYFGDSGEVAPIAIQHDPSKKPEAEKTKRTKLASKGVTKSKKASKVGLGSGDASSFGLNKCIDGGVRISVKQQEKFERQQRKRDKEQKKNEAAKQKAIEKKNKRAQAKGKKASEAKLVEKEASKEAPVDEIKAAPVPSGQVDPKEMSGNIAPSIPPFGLTRDSISSIAAAKAGAAISSSQFTFSAVTTLISDKIISLRAKVARALCPSPDQMLAVQAHEVERRQLRAAQAFLALQEGEARQKQFANDMKGNSEVYPNSTTSITGFGLVGRRVAEAPQEYEISNLGETNSSAPKRQ